MWGLFRSELFWIAFTAVATAVGSSAIVFAIRQLRFDAWLKAQEIWTGKEFREARAHILARSDKATEAWKPEKEELQTALEVCRKMDEFAGLLPYLPRRTALQVWGVPFAKAWLVLRPVVEQERAKCHWPEKWQALERLGEKALAIHPEILENGNS